LVTFLLPLFSRNQPKLLQKQAIQTFFGEATPRFIVAALTVAVGCRLLLASVAASIAVGGLYSPLCVSDVSTFVGVAAFWMVQEWALHDKLLHSKASWFGREIHAFHHDLPYYHLSLDGIGLAAVW